MSNEYEAFAAVSDFRTARQQAALQQVLARLTGRSTELLSFDDVTRQLGTLGSAEIGLQEIPLAAIAGSVGRTQDFTRDFLPRHDSDEGRWARVKAAAQRLQGGGLPPIRVYKIGEAYFVLDGHHRVSVARQAGAQTIEAYVTEVHTRASLSAAATEAEVAVQAEYAALLAATRLGQMRSGADLRVTTRDQVSALRDQMEAYRQTLAEEQGAEVGLPEAAASWFDDVYLPIVRVIREQGMLRDFPGQTEADLYLLVSARCADLEARLGWEIAPEVGALDLVARQKRQKRAAVVRAGARLLSAVVPKELQAGPTPGEWRRERAAARYGGDRLFADLLVPVSGEPASWMALDEALVLAASEGSRLQGLHVVANEAEAASPAAQAVRDEFQARCAGAGLSGTLAVKVGETSATIYRLAALSDLVVLHLGYPPASQLLAKLGSGFRAIIRRCPRPVLAVPQPTRGLERVVLAYDDSIKAREALFVAAYFAETRHLPLTVVTVKQGEAVTEDALTHARAYLEMHELKAEYLIREGEGVAPAVLGVASERSANLIVAGGYGSHPLLEAVLGSSVDQLLRETQVPVLICQ
ncbi:MAG: universal stress protein [Anaerolineales bacterium]|nr:universal stress protein [Anaerolineales bacterium]